MKFAMKTTQETMQSFFTPRRVAVVGASGNPQKIGRIIFDTVRKHFAAYPVNPHEKTVASVQAYPTVLAIPAKIDLAVIAVPGDAVLSVVNDCGKKGIRNIIVISSGFKEIGNDAREEELSRMLEKYAMKCIGPNCLGVFDAHSGLDTLFLPLSRLTRPKPGVISFISQSGAAGSALLDLLGYEGFGFAKFISYGNGTNISETDLLEYLGNDPQTKIICMYIEALKDGRKFITVAKNVKKPIILIKGGRTEKGAKATVSHTGSLAGSYQVYKGALKQAGILVVDSLREMFDAAAVFEELPIPKGRKIQIITNGGGYGILTADALEEEGLELATLHPRTKKNLAARFPPLVSISNPMDLIGDATNERYDCALEACINDASVDILVVILLYQTPLLDKNIVKVIRKYKGKKPIIVIAAGGKQTAAICEQLEKQHFPVFPFPTDAAKAIKKYVEYYF